jgi:ankyrin repeat protein
MPEGLNLRSKDNKTLAYNAAMAHDAKFNICAAIVHAIEDYEYDIFVQLLDFHSNHLPRPDRSNFTNWLSYAIHYRHEDMVQLLVDFAPGGKPMLLRNNLVQAFRGNGRMIKATLAKLNITDMNAGNIATIPLFMAVRSGKVAAVQIMLKQGSDPNVTAVSNMTSLSKLRVTPLDVALYHKFISVARCLLQNGADVPHISEWPTHRACYECLRDWEMEKTGAQIPTWSAARRLRDMGELQWLEY